MPSKKKGSTVWKPLSAVANKRSILRRTMNLKRLAELSRQGIVQELVLAPQLFRHNNAKGDEPPMPKMVQNHTTA